MTWVTSRESCKDVIIFLNTHSDPDTGMVHCQEGRKASISLTDASKILTQFVHLANIYSAAFCSSARSMARNVQQHSHNAYPSHMCTYLHTPSYRAQGNPARVSVSNCTNFLSSLIYNSEIYLNTSLVLVSSISTHTSLDRFFQNSLPRYTWKATVLNTSLALFWWRSRCWQAILM
jgi:hypothetical protein